jgi:hypothetical protein
MRHRNYPIDLKTIIVALTLAVLFTASQAFAQRPPNLPQSITSATASLSPEQSNQVQQFVAYWTGILKDANSPPESVEAAKAELVRPVNSLTVSALFRLNYGNLVEPELEQAVTGSTIHAGVNAMIAASFIGGERCMNFLIDHADRERQPKWQLRLHAAIGCFKVLGGTTLEIRRLQPAVNTLRTSARLEDNPLILRHLLAAIDAADQSRVPAAEREQLRATLVDTIADVVADVAKDPKRQTDGILAALADAVTMVRGKFIGATMNALELRAIGPKIAPPVGKLLELALANWDAGHADERSKQVYSAMIGGWEGFIAHVDSTLRGGATVPVNMRRSWDAGDKAAFETELAKWTAILKQPPYGK